MSKEWTFGNLTKLLKETLVCHFWKSVLCTHLKQCLSKEVYAHQILWLQVNILKV